MPIQACREDRDDGKAKHSMVKVEGIRGLIGSRGSNGQVSCAGVSMRVDGRSGSGVASSSLVVVLLAFLFGLFFLCFLMCAIAAAHGIMYV